jgi:hypothetical protein
VAPEDRVAEIGDIERRGEPRRFRVRAVLSDHIPLAGSMADILDRPSYHRMAVNDKRLTIFLHHGGRRAAFFDLVREGTGDWLQFVEVQVETRYTSNCFWSARTAVSQLLDSMMRTAWLPLVIRRLDLYIDGDDRPLCHQLMLPFTEGVRWGPLGGIHQIPFLTAYEALIREAITTGSPYYRLLCAYRLYEGLQPLRKTIRDLSVKFDVKAAMPKPPDVDLDELKALGFATHLLSKVKNAEDFWRETAVLRNGVSHFLLDDSPTPVSLSDGGSYQTYSLVGAVLLRYSHEAFSALHGHVSRHFADKLQRGSIYPMIDRRDDFLLRPDPPGPPSHSPNST